MQLGDGTQPSSGTLNSCSGCSSFPATNNSTFNVLNGECYTINENSTVTNNASIYSYGTINNYGSIFNNDESSNIMNECGGTLNNYASGAIENIGLGSFVNSTCPSGSCVATFLNDGTITNTANDSYSGVTTGTGTCEPTTNCNVDFCA